MVEIVQTLEHRVICHHPVVTFRNIRLENYRSHIGVVRRAKQVAYVVKQGADDVFLISPIALRPSCGLQAMFEAADGEAAMVVIEQAQLGR